MIWRPNVTVAAVVQENGKFLLVEEQTDEGMVLNQPAGHLEADETLLEGVMRETLEETAYRFQPRFLLGVYRWQRPGSDVTYLRFAFSGHTAGFDVQRKLDHGIIRAAWMTEAEIREQAHRHRSPLVLRCVQDYLAGKRYPLEILIHFQ
ncbi:MAG TPA: NUDIX hydrolase [Burkholderiales bacterium]|nr:NUDIX hydrolase [Burkholderiales bacterium]